MDYSGVSSLKFSVLNYKGKRRKPLETQGKFRVATSIHKSPKEINQRQSIGH